MNGRRRDAALVGGALAAATEICAGFQQGGVDTCQGISTTGTIIR